MQIITIDGIEYDADMLSADAKAQLISMQITDQKIANLQSELAILQTARSAYARELLVQLPKLDQVKAKSLH